MIRRNNENYDFLNEELIEELVTDLQGYFTNIDKYTLNLLHQNKIKKEEFLEKSINYLMTKGVNENAAKEAADRFNDYIFGYNILNELIEDKDISDIRIIDENNIRVKRLGKREGTNLKFKDKEDYIRFVNYIAVKNKVNIGDLNAIQFFTDNETSPDFILRFAIATSFLNTSGTPYVQIRKTPKEKRTLDQLVELNMMDENIKNYLVEKAKTSTGILFTGKGASGKTTIMNALIDEIPTNKSGLVIQESEELFSKIHPELMFQHVVINRGEGKIRYTLKDLARTGLLMDLDYFIIGEIKGEEARYFLNAAYTGHKCWASVHGVNSTEAMDKLADYIKDAVDYTKADILKMLRYVSVIVYMEDFKVKEISEITGYDEDKKQLIYKRIF